ncbi:cytochrome c oxidase subunit 3 [Botryobacter ruber]|uniref:cytochrome c oxidase subunit 3 n=1 Tax=Botryobacter ruber TaxID=2171629 RepID=UPI001F0CA666|nr:cytochrome c oxidase subunit III [Botryobacter ruber]
MPKLFSVSTLLLLFSSFTLNRVPRFYRKDKLKKMARYLGFTLAFGVSFVIAQFIGWNEISASGVSFTGKASGTYLYLITALHIVHLLGGLIFLSYLFFKTLHVNADGVRSLIFIRDPYRILQLTMLNSYWNFMGFLWLGLYLVFLFLV